VSGRDNDSRAASASGSLYPGLVAFLIVALAAVVIALGRVQRAAMHGPEPVRATNAVGDSTCISCHRDKAAFEQTAHRLTMRLPTRQAILGDFASESNVLPTNSPDVHFRMDADSTGFYQTLVVRTGADSTSRTERIAYVAGSGRKGQSFLYWSGDKPFQLPVSYSTRLDAWIGTPSRGGIDPRAIFNRPVAPRCWECHASWMQSGPNPSAENEYRPEGVILGLTCERCHASGQRHVAHERSLLHHVVRDRSIVNPARLVRERKMETCAQCHGGLGDSPDELGDMHANLVSLLSRSRCFTASQMTCTTCHDVHRPQRDVVELSGRCLTCHQQQSCKLFATRGSAIVGKCVDCHMPLRVQGRSHWIRVYPDSGR